jgi:torulene dioxygenase
MSLCHRFQIHAPTSDQPLRVTYNSRLTCDGLVKQIQKTGKLDSLTFGAKYDPCTSIFKKASSFFTKSAPAAAPDEITQAVSMSINYPGLTSKGRKSDQPQPNASKCMVSVTNKSDNDLLQMLDPVTGDVYNFNLDFVNGSGKYRIFVAEATTGNVDILATISAEPAYLHSFFLTEHYVLLCIWNSTFIYGGASILWNKNIADAIGEFDTRRRPTWYVIDRTPKGRGLVATYSSDPFFAFHTVNAYETPSPTAPGETDILADVTAYPNLDIIKRYYIDNLLSTSASAAQYARDASWRPQLRRFRLPSIPLGDAVDPPSAAHRTVESQFAVPRDLTPELATLDPRRVTKRYRYVYGVNMMGKSTLWDGLIKYDLKNHDADLWLEHGHSVSEPLFVPNPDAAEGDENEDDGVVLSVVLDGKRGRSYLLVLDAKDLGELGRAEVRGVIGHGFHGNFVGERDVTGWEAGTLHF